MVGGPTDSYIVMLLATYIIYFTTSSWRWAQVSVFVLYMLYICTNVYYTVSLKSREKKPPKVALVESLVVAVMQLGFALLLISPLIIIYFGGFVV
jgi:hypothetical protein